jgi:PAS domain S-box-containing protein
MVNNEKKPLPKLVSREPRKEAIKVIKDKSGLFEAIMDTIGDMVSIQDMDMRIVYQNRALQEMMGEHYGVHCYKVYERRETICEGCPIQESFKKGKIARALRTGITKEGKEAKFELITAPLKDRRGEIVAGIEVVRGVTEREEALAELKRRTEDLERFRALAVGRELKMIDLKKEIKKLQEELEGLKKKE